GEPGAGFGHGPGEDLVNVAAAQLDLEGLWRVALALALAAGHEEGAEELHLDVFKAVAEAAPTASRAAGAGEVTGRQGAGLALGGLREELADGVEKAGVDNGCRARCAGERGLVHHDHLADVAGAAQLPALADFSVAGGEAEGLE